MPLDVVKRKYRPVSGRQLSDSFIERYTVNHGHGIGVFRPFYYLSRRFSVFSRLLHAHAAFAKMHEHLIDGKPVQPGSKSGFAPKTTDFSKELNEDLLCEIFSLRDVAGHSQTERVYAAIMTLIKLFESCHVAIGGFLRQRIICSLRCLGFGCGHVLVHSGKLGRISQLPACFGTNLTLPRVSREQHCFLWMPAWGSDAEVSTLKRGCDAALHARRCLTRR